MARGSVQKRGSTWTIILDVGPDPTSGRRRQKWKGGFRTRKAAEAGLRELMTAVDAGHYVPSMSTSLADYLGQWLISVEPRLRPTSWNSYRIAVNRITAGLGAVALQALTSLEIEGFYAALLAGSIDDQRPLSAKTVRNTHIVLRKALGDAERLGLVLRNAAAAAHPPVPPKRDHTTWTPEELGAFLDSVRGERLRAAFVLLATTGMRRGEALGLRWGDLDLESGRAAIVQTITTVSDKIVVTPPKTARSRRSVSLDPATVDCLHAHGRRQAEERRQAAELWVEGLDLVFTNEIGAPVHPSTLSRRFEFCARRAGLPAIRLHDLRHTYATVALAAGVHPKIVSERLGHAAIGVTLDLYSHVTPTLDAAAANTIADRIFGVGPDAESSDHRS